MQGAEDSIEILEGVALEAEALFEAIEALFEEGGCGGGWGIDRPVD